MLQSRMRRGLVILTAALGILALYSSAAYASGAPIITGTSASNFKLNTTTVAGTIDPNGAAVSYKVEYGKSKVYGSTTPTITTSGTAPVSASQLVVGLEPLTTYHFRLSATNKYGTTVSEDMVGEMLLSWRVGGTRVSELGSAATFRDERASFESSLQLYGTSLGANVYILCNNKTTRVEGTLGAEYQGFTFGWCGLRANEVWISSCASREPVTFHFNAFLAQSEPTTIDFGSECSFGKMTFGSGGVGASADPEERTIMGPWLEGVTYFGQKPWVMQVSPGAWSLTGTNKGKVFGIS
jgi:hypothetical protein